MKLVEIKDLEDGDDDFPMAKLTDLSKHVWHGRAWVNDEDADKALDAVETGGDGDVKLWHGWMGDSATVYELSLSATSKEGIGRVLSDIRKAVPRAHLFIAHKAGMITHRDWKDF